MQLGTRRWRPLALAAAVLVLPRMASGGCSVPPPADRDGNGTLDLRIAGDAARQTVVAEIHNDGSYLVSVDCNNNSIVDTGDVLSSGLGPIETLSFELGGNDTITILQTDDLVGAVRNVVVALLGVSNSVTYNSQGHGILAASNLGIEIIGSTRFDLVTLDLTGSAITASKLVVRGDLGADLDRFDFFGPATMTGSALDLGFDLGSGANRLNWDDEAGTLTASTENVSIFGSDIATYVDTVTTDFSAKIEGGSRVDFSFKLYSGDDRYTGRFDVASYGVDSLGAAGSEARYYIHGGPGFDRLAVSSVGAGAAADNGLIEIRMDGYLQPDTLSFDWDGLSGSGAFRYRANGGDASDLILASLATDAASTNDIDAFACTDSEGDISLQGDTAYLAVVDRGAASAGPAGAAIVNGGLDGIDACSYFGNLPHHAFNCEAGTF